MVEIVLRKGRVRKDRRDWGLGRDSGKIVSWTLVYRYSFMGQRYYRTQSWLISSLFTSTSKSNPDIWRTALLASRKARHGAETVLPEHSAVNFQFSVLNAMLIAVVPIARWESRWQTQWVEFGTCNSFTAVAEALSTLPNLLTFPFHAFMSRVYEFSIPPRILAGENGWKIIT